MVGCTERVDQKVNAKTLRAAGVSRLGWHKALVQNPIVETHFFSSGLKQNALGLPARLLGIPSPSRTKARILLYLQIPGREGLQEVFLQ